MNATSEHVENRSGTHHFPTAQLHHFAEINPSTPEFSNLQIGEPVTFMSLDSVWPDGRANVNEQTPWTGQLQSYTPFHSGDILLPKVSPTFSMGRATIPEIPRRVGIASSEVYVVRSRANADARFITYTLRSTPFLQEGTASQQGVGGLRRVSTNWVRAYHIPALPIAEQRRIADYLDRETAQIDAMAGALDGLVARLEERRTETVDQYIFPKGSPIGKLGYAVQNVDQGISPGPARGKPGKFKVLKSGCVNGGIFHDKEVKPVDSSLGDLSNLLVTDGDLIVSRASGSARFVGAAGIVTEPSPGTILSDKTYRLSLLPEHSRRFIVKCLNSRSVRAQIERSISGASGLAKNIGLSNVLSLKIPLPPLDEQRRIADHLDGETAKIDAMIAKAGELRALLDERRSALITATVTGQHPVPEEH